MDRRERGGKREEMVRKAKRGGITKEKGKEGKKRVGEWKGEKRERN